MWSSQAFFMHPYSAVIYILLICYAWPSGYGWNAAVTFFCFCLKGLSKCYQYQMFYVIYANNLQKHYIFFQIVACYLSKFTYSLLFSWLCKTVELKMFWAFSYLLYDAHYFLITIWNSRPTPPVPSPVKMQPGS